MGDVTTLEKSFDVTNDAIAHYYAHERIINTRFERFIAYTFHGSRTPISRNINYISKAGRGSKTERAFGFNVAAF